MQKPEYTVKSLGEYQALMERFENFNDPFILPDLRLVVRLDGRRIGAYWDSIPAGDYPYSETFHEALIGAAAALMRQAIQVQLSFVHGDEISLVLDPCESTNPRRRTRLVSILASAASLQCFEESGVPLLFHARLSELPTGRHLLDYLFWQRKTAARNFVSAQLAAYFTSKGESPQEIDKRIAKLTIEERYSLAEKSGLGINSSPPWQLRGAVVAWEQGKDSTRKLVVVRDLPADDQEYAAFIGEKCLADPSRPKAAEPAKPPSVKTGPFKLSRT